MIKLLSVNPTGLFSYGRHRTIPLDNQGIVLLDGVNGSGKSSLMNVITTLLFDKNPPDGSGEDIVNIVLKKCCAKLEFISDLDVHWRIVYTRKWKRSDQYPDQDYGSPVTHLDKNFRYSGTELYLERNDNGVWVDEFASANVGSSRIDMKTTRAKILDIVDMSYEQFLSVAYLAQQQSMKFMVGTHKERLEVITDLCDLSVWDRRIDVIKSTISTYETDLLKLETEYKANESIANTFKLDDISTCLVELNRISIDLNNTDINIAALDVDIKKWETDCLALDAKYKNTISIIKSKTIELNDVRMDTASLIAEYGDIYKNIRMSSPPQNINILESDINLLRTTIQLKRIDLEQMITGEGKCQRCKTYVTVDHVLRHKELITVEIKELEDKLARLNTDLGAAKDIWEQDLLSQLDMAKVGLEALKLPLDQKLTAINKDLDALNTEVVNIETARTKLLSTNPNDKSKQLLLDRYNILIKKNSLEHKISDHNTQLEKYNAISNGCAVIREMIVSKQNQVRHLKVLINLFGDKGIKAYKLTSILSMLNHLVKQYIDILSDDTVDVVVTPFREKSDGSSTVDIQILVTEGIKQSVPINLYSGGERQRIALAFIGAFWQLATSQSHGVNLLLLDEVFSNLDESNSEKVLDFIDRLKSLGKSSVFITIHNPVVRDLINYDKKYVITKKNHTSTIMEDNSLVTN